MFGPPWYTDPPDPILSYGEWYVEQYGVDDKYWRRMRRHTDNANKIIERFIRWMDKREPEDDQNNY